MAVKFQDILEAFELVSFGSMYEYQAFLDKETGKIYYHSEFGDDEEKRSFLPISMMKSTSSFLTKTNWI